MSVFGILGSFESFQYVGEIAAITNCTDILTNKHGRFKLTSLEALEAFKEFTLYTNAESCPMVNIDFPPSPIRDTPLMPGISIAESRTF